MGDKRFVIKNREGGWDVRAPAAHNPSSQHDTYEEALLAAKEWCKSVEGGRIDVVL